MNYLQPNWPAPPQVKAFCSTRKPGSSQPPFASNNLAQHVEDNPETVAKNRSQLVIDLQLPNEPEWLNQYHSDLCVVVENDANRKADASVTREPNRVLSILTADCLPILLCNRDGSEVAAIHAGWKGLSSGIIESTLAKMHSAREHILAWCGPALCPSCFEVGSEVCDQFISAYPFTAPAFEPRSTKFLANFGKLTQLIFQEQGVHSVFLSNRCTLEEKNEFYSYRREQKTGRIASLIWLTQG